MSQLFGMKVFGSQSFSCLGCVVFVVTTHNTSQYNLKGYCGIALVMEFIHKCRILLELDLSDLRLRPGVFTLLKSYKMEISHLGVNHPFQSCSMTEV